MKLTSSSFTLKTMAVCIHIALTSTAVLSTSAALAQSTNIQQYHIAAGSLNQVLNQFAAQSGTAIAMDGNKLSQINSQGLEGQYDIAQGFEALLAATNYRVENTSNGYIIVEKNPNTVQESASPAENTIATGALNVAGTTGGIAGNRDTPSSAFDTYQLAGAVHHVSREQLEQVSYSRVGDILTSTPGVAAANSANSAGLQVNIRGLQGQGRVRTLIDGAQQSVSTYRGYSGNRDDTYIDPDLIGAIDIKKGPDADATSAGVIGGVVAIRTLNADDIITDPNKNWGVRIRGMMGNNVSSGDTCAMISDEFRRCIHRASGTAVSTDGYVTNYTDFGGKIPTHNFSGSIATAWRPAENMELTVAHAERETGNYESGKNGVEKWRGIYPDFAGMEVPNTSIDSKSTLVKAKLGFLDHQSVALSYVDYENNAGYYSSTAATFTGPKAQAHLRKTTAKNYTLNYAWQPDSPWVNLRLNLWGTKVNGGEDLADYVDVSGIEIQSKIFGGELFNTTSFPIPVGQLNWKYGASFSNEKTQFGLNEGMDADTGFYVNGEKQNTGLFTSLNWQATPWLTLNAGLQHNNSRAKNLDTRLIESFQGYYPQNQHNSFSSTTPNFNITLQPIDELMFFASWNKAKRTPSIRELYMSTVVESDPNLRPEDQRNFEYGISFNKKGLITEDDQFGIKLSRFDNLTNDYIARVSWASLGENRFEHNASYVFRNIDKVQLKGTELSMDYDNKYVFANMGLTYFDSVKACYPDRTIFDKAIPTQCYSAPSADDWSASYMPPRFEANATLGVKLLQSSLKIGAKVHHATASQSGGSLRGVKVSNMIWDKYTVYDLFGNYKVNKNWEVGFSVENLTNRYYIPSYANALEALPAPGRTARATVTFSY